MDDTLIDAVEVTQMKMALAAVIESIFVVMGQPDLSLRQCPLAMDKWSNLVVAEHQLALGLVIDPKKMVVKMTEYYLADTLDLIKSIWPSSTPSQKGRKRCTAFEASKLVGKLGRLREGAPWSRYMVSQLYSSTAFAPAQNKETLGPHLQNSEGWWTPLNAKDLGP